MELRSFDYSSSGNVFCSPTLLDKRLVRYSGASLLMILYIRDNFLLILLCDSVSHTVSWYKEFNDANTGKPVTILAAFS